MDIIKNHVSLDVPLYEQRQNFAAYLSTGSSTESGTWKIDPPSWNTVFASNGLLRPNWVYGAQEGLGPVDVFADQMTDDSGRVVTLPKGGVNLDSEEFKYEVAGDVRSKVVLERKYSEKNDPLLNPTLVWLDDRDFEVTNDFNLDPEQWAKYGVLWSTEPLGDARKTGFTLNADYFVADGLNDVKYKGSHAGQPAFESNLFIDKDKFGEVRMEYGDVKYNPYGNGPWLGVNEYVRGDATKDGNLVFNEERLRDTIKIVSPYTYLRPNYGGSEASVIARAGGRYMMADPDISVLGAGRNTPWSVSTLDESGNVVTETRTTSDSARLVKQNAYFINGGTYTDNSVTPAADSTFAAGDIVPQWVLEQYGYVETDMTMRTELKLDAYMIGLGNVNNTPDMSKPVSYYQSKDLKLTGAATGVDPNSSQAYYNENVGTDTDYSTIVTSGYKNVKNRIGDNTRDIEEIKAILDSQSITNLGYISNVNGIPDKNPGDAGYVSNIDYLNGLFPPNNTSFTNATYVVYRNTGTIWAISVGATPADNIWYDTNTSLDFMTFKGNYANVGKLADATMRYAGTASFGEETDSVDSGFWASMNHTHGENPSVFHWGTITDATDYYNPTIAAKTLEVVSVDETTALPRNLLTFGDSVNNMQINVTDVRESQYLHDWSSYTAYGGTNPTDGDPGTPTGNVSTFTPGTTTNGRFVRVWSGTQEQYAVDFGGADAPSDVLAFITNDIQTFEGDIIDSYILTNSYMLPFRREIMRGTGSAPFTPLPSSDPLYAADGGQYLYTPVNGKIQWTPFDSSGYVVTKSPAGGQNINIDDGGFTVNNVPVLGYTPGPVNESSTGRSYYRSNSVGGPMGPIIQLGSIDGLYLTYSILAGAVGPYGTALTATNGVLRSMLNRSLVYQVYTNRQIGATARTVGTLYDAIDNLWGDVETIYGDLDNATTGVKARLTAVEGVTDQYPTNLDTAVGDYVLSVGTAGSAASKRLLSDSLAGMTATQWNIANLITAVVDNMTQAQVQTLLNKLGTV